MLITFNNWTCPCLTSWRKLLDSVLVVAVSVVEFIRDSNWIDWFRLLIDKTNDENNLSLFKFRHGVVLIVEVVVVVLGGNGLVLFNCSKSVISCIVLRRWIRKCLLTNEAELVNFFLVVVVVLLIFWWSSFSSFIRIVLRLLG